MKVVVATDKWRGTFSSRSAGEAICRGARRALPGAEIRVVPLADGGEGTLEVVLGARGGDRRELVVPGPLGEAVSASWGVLPDGTAVVESAAACGLALLPGNRRDPLHTSSRGMGALVRAALDAGCRHLVLALGGTASVDGGVGMAAVLGTRFLDASGMDLPPGGGALRALRRIDPSGAIRPPAATPVEAWCDVANPLVGPRGAARTFGPQKGAGPPAVRLLESGLQQLARQVSRDLGVSAADLAGSGAGGGLGFGASAFLGATLLSGARQVLEAIRFGDVLQGADLVITGEGEFNPWEMPGKAPEAVRSRAQAAGVPAVVVCARHRPAPEGREPALPEVLSAADLPGAPAGALREEDLARLGELAARRLARR